MHCKTNFLFCSQVTLYWSTQNNLTVVLRIQIELWLLFNSCSLQVILHFHGFTVLFQWCKFIFSQNYFILHSLYILSPTNFSAVVTTGKTSSSSTDCVYLKLFQHTEKDLTGQMMKRWSNTNIAPLFLRCRYRLNHVQLWLEQTGRYKLLPNHFTKDNI